MYNVVNFSLFKGVFTMKLMKKMIVALLCLVLVLGVSGCGKLNISREIAKVEGRIITEAEFKFYLENVKSQTELSSLI